MVIFCQCSPYQAVTGKIYRLKQHFLPPSTAWRFNKIKLVVLKNTQIVIRFDQGNELIYGTVIKYTQRFFLWATHSGKRAFEDS